MTSFRKARYALWNHESSLLGGQIQWRKTPKSNDFVAVVAPAVLSGTVQIQCATPSSITITLQHQQQQEALQAWTSKLPADVLPLSCMQTQTITHTGPYGTYDAQYNATTQVPVKNEMVRVRLTCSVKRVGSMRKAHLQIIDVLRCNIPETSV